MRLWLRSGVTRHVIITARYAFKFPNVRNGWPLFLRGILANLSEQEWGNYVESTIPPNPVIHAAPLGFCNMYRRAQPFEERLDERVLDEDGNMVEDPALDALDFTPWGDKKRSNIGIVGGRLVMIDYDMSACACLGRRCQPSPETISSPT